MNSNWVSSLRREDLIYLNNLISYCSQYISLTEGDLILTGTPEGVGAIKPGDSIEGTASLDGKVLASLNFKVT